jgi:hypothetical protein
MGMLLSPSGGRTDGDVGTRCEAQQVQEKWQ